MNITFPEKLIDVTGITHKLVLKKVLRFFFRHFGLINIVYVFLVKNIK
ncbi:hypothetical protein ACFL2K_04000 [Candidatus Margulisiibacteriota bacterium]